MSQIQTQNTVRTCIFSLRVGHSRSRSGKLWHRWIIVKAWIEDNDKYVEADPRAVLEPLNKNWYRSSTKLFADIEFKAPAGTIIKYITMSERGTNVHYYLITETKLVELEHESVREYLVKTPKVAIWYYKNIVKLPDGRELVDVDSDPRLYSVPVAKRTYRLSELDELKKELGVQ